MQWLKLPVWKVGDRGFEPHSGIQVSKKKKFLPRSQEFNIGRSLREREVACSASDREFCVWRASRHSSHHPQVILQALFNLYVHKCDLKIPFISFPQNKIGKSTRDHSSPPSVSRLHTKYSLQNKTLPSSASSHARLAAPDVADRVVCDVGSSQPCVGR